MTNHQPLHCREDGRKLVLASTSPRRRDLLHLLGLSFELDASTVDEAADESAPIESLVHDLASQKARQVAPRHDNALVIAADTLVEVDGRVFGKPVDPADARRMLRSMRNRRHRVLTGLVVLDSASMQESGALVETSVFFREVSDAEIDAYVASGEPLDKAGAYGIQGLGAVFVSRIEGDYYNVAGLPIAALNRLLGEAGCCIICRSRATRQSAPGPA